MGKRIHILIAEPSAIVRCGLVTLLQGEQKLMIDIAELSDVSSVLSGFNGQSPDILIVNPSNLGVFSPSALKSSMGNENMKIIALQSSFAEQSLLQNYDATISIYDNIDVIVEKISATVNDPNETDASKDDLSIREKEIIVCVVKGLTNKQIAENLYLSIHTVIAHRRNIANKLKIHSPSGLTIYAIVNKLVDLADVKNSISSNSDE